MKEQISTLNGHDKNIEYEIVNDMYKIQWGKQVLTLTQIDLQMILDKYFVDENNWYPLGASMTKPMNGGLGEFLKENFKKFTPRDASVIAAIMCNENLISAKGKKPILLKKYHLQE